MMNNPRPNLLEKLSWSAIFAGTLTGFAINFLFNLFTLALGVTIFTLSDTGITKFSYLGLVLYGVSAILSMFITGWVAGRLTPPVFISKGWGGLTGFIAWSLLLISTIIILMNMLQFISFHSNFTSHPKLVSVRITNNLPMMTESNTNKDSLSKGIDIEKTTKVFVLNAHITFLLFLLGSLASIVGGYRGYSKQLLFSRIKPRE